MHAGLARAGPVYLDPRAGEHAGERGEHVRLAGPGRGLDHLTPARRGEHVPGGRLLRGGQPTWLHGA